jgi:ATP-dependent HslUV protease ATP-binding subunit HslU
LKTENVELDFKDEGIKRLAEISWHINEKTENIGARRLYTVMEKLLEEVSFQASKYAGKTIQIDKNYVNEKLEDLSTSEDLSRYVL